MIRTTSNGSAQQFSCVSADAKPVWNKVTINYTDEVFVQDPLDPYDDAGYVSKSSSAVAAQAMGLFNFGL